MQLGSDVICIIPKWTYFLNKITIQCVLKFSPWGNQLLWQVSGNILSPKRTLITWQPLSVPCFRSQQALRCLRAWPLHSYKQHFSVITLKLFSSARSYFSHSKSHSISRLLLQNFRNVNSFQGNNSLHLKNNSVTFCPRCFCFF